MTAADDTIADAVFRSSRPVAFSEVDLGFRMRVPAMLRRFQDAAARHSELVGLGIRSLREQGRCWVLNRLLLDHVAGAGYDEPLAVATWSRGAAGLRMRRDFELLAGERVVARGTSLWFLMDLDARRPVALTNDVQNAYGRGAREAVPDTLTPWLPPKVPAGALAVVFTPRDADHDPGRHVNNCVYAEWLLDACGRHGIGSERVAGLRLAFERAIAPGTAAVRVDIAPGDGAIAGQIVVDGVACARAELGLRSLRNHEEDCARDR